MAKRLQLPGNPPCGSGPPFQAGWLAGLILKQPTSSIRLATAKTGQPEERCGTNTNAMKGGSSLSSGHWLMTHLDNICWQHDRESRSAGGSWKNSSNSSKLPSPQ